MSLQSKSTKAYSGFFGALLGGLSIGFGAAILFITRMAVEIFGSVGDPVAFSNLNIVSFVMIALGLVLSGIGIFEIYSSLTAESLKLSTIPTEKKFCQYCRTENNANAVFCQKCGQKIE